MSEKSSLPVLQIQDLAVSYETRGGPVEAVSDLSINLRSGESFGLVGESGCGKSTVVWSVVNYLGKNGRITRGSVRFQGEEFVDQEEAELQRLRGDRIGLVYQNPTQSLNPTMLVGHQLTETLTYHRRMARAEARKRCKELLGRVHMPDPEQVMNCYPHQLSGGQQQRVVIAMSLLNDPALLLMDEPTTALDVTVEAAVLDLIDEVRRDNDAALLFISHNLGVVAKVCDQIGVMYAGELVEQAPSRTIYGQPRHPYTQGLLDCLPRLGDAKENKALFSIPGQVPSPAHRPYGCRFAPRCAYAQERCQEEAPELRRLNDGWVRCHFAEDILVRGPVSTENLAVASRNDSSPSRTDLTVRELKTDYVHPGSVAVPLIGKKRLIHALNGVSFDLPSGQTLGVVGESGCGKSTLVKTLIGLESAASGNASFMGFDLTVPIKQRDQRLIREIQMVFQDPESTLNPSFTIGHQLSRVVRRAGESRLAVKTRVSELLESVRLNDSYRDRYPHQLSGGEKQRIGIARAFASHPALVLCDEPVSALDVSVQSAILNLLLDIQRQYGTTMIFISHDLGIVRYFSDFVAVMYLGQIMEIGPAEAVFAPPHHPYTEALLSATPDPDPDGVRSPIRLEGSLPSPVDPPSGCPFQTRCPRKSLLPDAGAVCATEAPPMREPAYGHRLFCHLPHPASHGDNVR